MVYILYNEQTQTIPLFIGDNVLKLKDARIESFDYSVPSYQFIKSLNSDKSYPYLVDSTQEFTIRGTYKQMIYYVLENSSGKPVSNKMVEDCSIEELLFAIKCKIKEENKSCNI